MKDVKEKQILDDNTIVEFYLKRDERAIKSSSEKYGKRLHYLAEHITADSFSADECENDTYMQAWNNIPPHEPRDYLYAFLARITRHIALNICEKNNALKRHGDIAELGEELDLCIAAEDNTERVIDDMALKTALNSFLASLDEEKRNIFIRRYWFMDDISDISERYGYSQSKIKSMLMRLRLKLREKLDNDNIL